MKANLKVAVVIVLSVVILIFMLNKNDKNFDNNIMMNSNENINILMINSYHQGHYWEGYVLEGLNNELSKYDEYNINLKIEYLDFRSKNSEEYKESFKKLLESKYKDSDIDIVYAVNDEAYEFTKEIHNDEESIFYELPMVMTGVDQDLSEVEEHETFDALGFYHVDDTINLLRLILDLNKDVEKLNLIMEDSLYCKSVTKEILSYLDTMSELAQRDIKVDFVTGNYIEDIGKKLKDVEQNSNAVNIVAGEFQYKDSKNFLNPKDTVNIIKSINPEPIYSNDQTYLNAGILGGCVDIGQRHGEVAADLIIKAVNGLDLSTYNLEAEPLAEVYLDYESIYNYGINISDIDSHMNIINKKFYQLLIPQKMKILLLYVFILVILISIIMVTKITKHIEKSKKIIEEEKIRILRDNLKSDFIVNLSHELRTPINVILNASRIIESNINNKSLMENKLEFVKDSIEDKLELINNNSYRLLKISNNIIDVTMAESGLLKLELKNENIVDIVEESFMNSIDFAKKKNINMVFDSSKEEIITAIDKEQIQRVILNLISNAIKFTREGGNIEVNINENKNEILIEVRDTGIGIREEYLEKIFDNFYQVDDSLTRMNEGTGIGLCIVKDIVTIHGGRIEVESKENEGSNFKVYIPIKVLKEKSEEEKVININYDIKTMANIELSDIM